MNMFNFFKKKNKIDKIKCEKIIRKAGKALVNHMNAPMGENEDISITIYLVKEFGFQQGNKMSPDMIIGLSKALDFAKTCMVNDWVNNEIQIIDFDKVQKLFDSMFNDNEIKAFEKI